MLVIVLSLATYVFGSIAGTLSATSSSAIAAPPDRRLTSTTMNMMKIAASARNPARENVMITAAMLRSAVPAATSRGRPRELRARAPASGMIRFSINARSLGLPVSPELPW